MGKQKLSLILGSPANQETGRFVRAKPMPSTIIAPAETSLRRSKPRSRCCTFPNAARCERHRAGRLRPRFCPVFGDDQYENFREDGVPPFCVFALDEIESRPFARGFMAGGNVWNAAADATMRTRGHAAGGRYLAAKLIEMGFDTNYAYACGTKPACRMHSSTHCCSWTMTVPGWTTRSCHFT
jgi:hypothetical protein